MAATTGYRTLYPAVIPAASAHLFTLTSTAHPVTNLTTVEVGASFSSFLIDFFFRSSGKAHILSSTAVQFPHFIQAQFKKIACMNYLRLNCLTSAYAPLWEEITGERWTRDTPLRIAVERIKAQNEIDAIVALSLGITADELCMIYRTQFPVMRRYDRENLYDAHGRKVPNAIKKLHEQTNGEEILTVDQRTWVHPQSNKGYVNEYPFSPLDRERGLREAYEHFQSSVVGK